MAKTLTQLERDFLLDVKSAPGETWRGDYAAKIMAAMYHAGYVRVDFDGNTSYLDAAYWLTTAGEQALAQGAR